MTKFFLIGGGIFVVLFLIALMIPAPQGELDDEFQSEAKIRDVESDDVDVRIQFKEGGTDNNELPVVIVDEPESTDFGVGNDLPVVEITPEEESGGTLPQPTDAPQDLSDFE